MKLSLRSRPQSVLALSLSGGQLRAAEAARSRDAIATARSAAATLSLDLAQAQPEALGREIHAHLASAGIRERHCVVALPADWIMTLHSRVPDLSPEDSASLLQIEAEKGFPCDLEELQIARSHHRSSEGLHVTQFAVRHEQLARLGEILKAAGLKPLSFTLGASSLPGALAPAGQGALTLALEATSATLLASAGGGLTALRVLDTADASPITLARELRISLEQIPPDLRREIRRLSLRGDPASISQVSSTLAPWAREAGLTLDTAATASSRSISEEIVSSLAERHLRGEPATLEFLPPRPSRWSQLVARYSAKRLATAGAAAAALALAALGVFGWQEYRRWSLRTEWNAMSAQVADLEATQARIREYRPWFDTSFRNLTIMKRVVECFPDNGSVTAKTFEIHGPANVSVSGTARDNASLLRTLDQLRQAKEIQGLKIEQIRGKTPAQFTFTFRWVGSSGT